MPMHKTILTCVSAAVAATIVLAILRARSAGPSGASAAEQQWKIHDRSRPQPPVITPGESSTQDRPGRPPSDAIVLFGGAGLSKWQAADGGPAKWKVGDGYFEVAPGTGDMQTRDAFGDCQLHVEWAAPGPARGEDQDRGTAECFCTASMKFRCSIPTRAKPTPTDRPPRSTGNTLHSSTPAVRRASGRPTTSSSMARASTRRANSHALPTSPCCTTACWRRTT